MTYTNHNLAGKPWKGALRYRSEGYRLERWKPGLERPKPRCSRSMKALANTFKEENQFPARQGANAGDGFVIEVTDGHRALLLPGKADKQKPDSSELFRLGPNKAVFFEELFLAMLLIKPCVDWQKVKATEWCFKEDKRFVLRARSPEALGATEIECGIEKLSKPMIVGLDWNYVYQMLGNWPLIMRWTDPESPVIFHTAEDKWRYAIMPVRVLEEGWYDFED